MNTASLRPLFILASGLWLGGCALGPDYQRPEVPLSEDYRHVEGWQPVAQQRLPGQWWTLYGDAQLDRLVEQLGDANQNLADYEARYRQALALTRASRSNLFPSLNSTLQRSRQGGGGESDSSSSYSAGLGLSWELDLWGKLRRTLEADQASLQASKADLAGIQLSLQSELVLNYLQLRVLDEHKRLLDATLAAYGHSLRLSENQYQAGIVSKVDVVQARAQLKSTQAQAIDLEWQRAQLEHAIAILIGTTPAQFRLEEVASIPRLPAIPSALPGQLLQQRPDIAAAEQRVAAANARIGVAQAAWFPDLTLSASGGYRSGSFNQWFEAPNRYWSLGPQLALTLFDAGARRSLNDQTEAQYDQTVAQYRQSVLTGLREVEDYLVQLEVLEREAVVQAEALEASRESLRFTENQYKAGTIDYLSVVTVQTTTLGNERTNLNLLGNRLAASVRLIAALGGGWNGLAAEQNDAGEKNEG